MTSKDGKNVEFCIGHFLTKGAKESKLAGTRE